LLPSGFASMAPPEGASLLPTELDGDGDYPEPLEGSQRSSRCRPVLVGSALVLATFAAACLARWGGDGVPGRAATKDNMRGFSLLGSSYAASQTCYGFTGGTCKSKSCDGYRNAACVSGQCVCEGSCAGADGSCYTGKTNTMVAVEFTLTNVKFSKYSMYFQGVSAFGQLKTTNAYSLLNLGKDKFSLYKMPGNASMSRFLLGSEAYPDKVARIGFTTGTAVHPTGFYSTDLQDGKGPDKLGVSACYNAAKKALMFGRSDGVYWAYLTRGTWLVYGYKGDQSSVGDGGLWTPTPAFTQSQIAMLPKC